MSTINPIRVRFKKQLYSFYSGSVVTDGLVLNLDAGLPASYPGSGTTWFDLSGSGNDGTLTNGPTYSSSNGGSLVFDGSNDYVNLNFPFTQSSSANSYTIVMGAKLSTTSSSRYFLEKTFILEEHKIQTGIFLQHNGLLLLGHDCILITYWIFLLLI
jgi:hypothetical protein